MGTLYVVATPIGNLEDITIRAIKVLLTTPVVACEDTRHTGNLLKILKDRYQAQLGIEMVDKPQLMSVRDWNEAEVIEKVLFQLKLTDIALVSDAGTPLVSDPGFKVVRAARAAGFTVSPIPGPSAAIAALSAAGLSTDKFVFLGFLPKKWELMPNITNIIYESPHRLESTISQIQTRYPGASIIVAKELTKIHEEIFDPQLTDESLKLKLGEAVILVNFSPT